MRARWPSSRDVRARALAQTQEPEALATVAVGGAAERRPISRRNFALSAEFSPHFFSLQ